MIGAGLSGLACARVLTEAGIACEVWEASGDIGGRVGTDVVDGFLCDRGFQVLNPAYPAVRRHVDVRALGLGRFDRGVAVRTDDGLHAIHIDPRHPAELFHAARATGIGLGSVVPLARWFAPTLRPPRAWLGSPDRTLGEGLADSGVMTPARDRLLVPFLSGVVLGDPLATSEHFVRLVVRSLALAAPGVPAQGMTALPHQLAAGLADAVRLDRRVRSVARDGDGWRVEADDAASSVPAVVVATDPASAGELAGTPVPAMHGCVTDWFACPAAPSPMRLVCIDSREGALIVNTAVMSNVAPSYAPAGEHLVQATCLWRDGEAPPPVADVQRAAGDVYRADPSGWRHLMRHELPRALPAQPPPLDVRRDVDLGDGRFVCGDHRDTASIQGALVSGRRAARAVASHLGRPLPD